MRTWIALLFLLPAASAGFEVHHVEPPAGRLVPETGVGIITVDLDIDCQSVWIHDPYVIDIQVASAANVSGPDRLTVPMSECNAPQGITEQFIDFTVTVPLSLPAYTAIPVGFTFTSGNHLADPAQSHAGATSVQAQGAPEISVTPSSHNVSLPQRNVTLTIENRGNVDVEPEWTLIEGAGIALEIPLVPRGATVQVNATLIADLDDATPSLLRLTPIDVEGQAGPDQEVAILWTPAPKATPPKDSPAGWLVAPALLLAALLRRQAQSRPTSTDTA